MNWQSFLIAGRFLTRLPFPEPKDYSTERVAQSVAYYPLIGLILGAILYGFAVLLEDLNLEISAFIILFAWVWLTGALHLDGYADTVDAWVGGLGNKERTLEIMKDPTSGSMAVVALIILLLGKWITIKFLFSHDQIALLLWLPVISRCQLAPYFIYAPYAKASGMGVAIAGLIQRPLGWGIISSLMLGAGLHLGVLTVALLIIASLIVFSCWRYLVIQRLGGVTGDTAGALVELTELTLLLLVPLVITRLT